MKGFNKFLKEGASSTLKELIFYRGNEDIIVPLSAPMWERLLGKQSEVWGVHNTDWEGLEILQRIEGSRKQISVMTELADNEIKKFVKSDFGILTDGGVWVLVKGTPIVKFGRDIGSQRDEQGRRWVQLAYKIDDFPELEEELRDKIVELKENIYQWVIEAQNDNPELQVEYGSFDPEDPDRWRSDDIWNFDHISDGGTGKEKAAAIQKYIDGVEWIVSERIDEIMEALGALDYATQSGWGWNEIILNNFSMEAIVFEFRQSFNYGTKMSKLGELDPKRVKRNFKVRWVEIANAKHEDAISKIKGLFTFIKGTQK